MLEDAEAPLPAPHLHARSAIRGFFVVDQRRLPVLLASVLVFVTARLALGASAALADAIGLWCGYCIAFLAVAALARAETLWRGSLLPAMFVALAIGCGATSGTVIDILLWSRPQTPLLEHATRWAWHLAFVAALIAVPASQSIALARRSARAAEERARVTAHLMTLQAQIEPHFLFNTLATLRSLIRRDGEAAAGLLDRMTDFFRAVLPDARQTTSTLGREATIVASYLSIMQARLGTRLAYAMDISPSLDVAKLPPLLIQPLVENAIKHGIEPAEAGGTVSVTAQSDGDSLVIEVINTGEPLRNASDHTRHTGLANVRSRLDAIYGDHASLILSTDEAGTTLATLRIPCAIKS